MNRDPAMPRFLVIQLVRLTGAALVVLGLLIVNRKVDLPALAGYLLLVAGLVDLFVVPQILSRRWRSQGK